MQADGCAFDSRRIHLPRHPETYGVIVCWMLAGLLFTALAVLVWEAILNGRERPPAPAPYSDWWRLELPPAQPPEPWRNGRWENVIVLERAQVMSWADPVKLRDASRECERMARVEKLAHEGFEEPVTAVVNGQGRIVLKDGYHRMVIAERDLIEMIPVRFRVTGRNLPT